MRRGLAAALAAWLAATPAAAAGSAKPGVAGQGPRDDAARAVAGEGPRKDNETAVPVTFVSKDAGMRVYVARGDARYEGAAGPDPFEKLAPLPVTVRLAPGTYSVEAESPTSSFAQERIVVEHDAPLRVEVKSGNAEVKLFGDVFVGLGIVSILLGIVTIVSIAPGDQSFDRWGIGLPLAIGGAGVAGLGVGMVALGSTNIDAPRLPPGGVAHASRGVALLWRF